MADINSKDTSFNESINNKIYCNSDETCTTSFHPRGYLQEQKPLSVDTYEVVNPSDRQTSKEDGQTQYYNVLHTEQGGTHKVIIIFILCLHDIVLLLSISLNSQYNAHHSIYHTQLIFQSINLCVDDCMLYACCMQEARPHKNKKRQN